MRHFTMELDQAELEFLAVALAADIQIVEHRLKNMTKRDRLRRVTLFESWEAKKRLANRLNREMRQSFVKVTNKAALVDQSRGTNETSEFREQMRTLLKDDMDDDARRDDDVLSKAERII